MKEELLLHLNAAVQRIWPAAFIEIYGSYVTKLSSSNNSDLDLVVCFGDSGGGGTSSSSNNNSNNDNDAEKKCSLGDISGLTTTATADGGNSCRSSSSSSSSFLLQKSDRNCQSVSNLIGVRGVIPLLQTLAEFLPPEMGMLDNEPVLK